MIPLGCGLLVGTGIGVAASKLIATLGRKDPVPVGEVSDEERDQIEANFAAHLGHMRSQVSAFADVLAGDDPLLRERLRVFEGGGRS